MPFAREPAQGTGKLPPLSQPRSAGNPRAESDFVPGLSATTVNLYRKAAERDDPTAYTHLGYLLERGQGGVAKDVPAAAALYRLTAELGDADAMYNLAVLVARGEGGVAKDVPAAAALFKQAAECGDADAMGNLALLLERGDDGVAKDVLAAAAL